MNRLLLIFLILLFGGTAPSYAQKIGSIDYESIFQLMPEYVAAGEIISTKSKSYEAERIRLYESFDKEYAEFQSLEENNPIRNSRMQALQELNNRIATFYEQAKKDLEDQQLSLYTPIKQKINAVLRKVARDNSFLFIYDQTSLIFPGCEVVDCTNLVKAELGLK